MKERVPKKTVVPTDNISTDHLLQVSNCQHPLGVSMGLQGLRGATSGYSTGFFAGALRQQENIFLLPL